jgi:hypothetical protein
MHIEILIEDSSGAKLLETLLPQFFGEHGNPHSWRITAYKGVGRIPQGLTKSGNPKHRILLDQLPRLLRGFGQTPSVDAVVVVLDADKRNCEDLLVELKVLAAKCHGPREIMFRLAIEEMEAWYLGDRFAVKQAYPRAKEEVLRRYVQDSVCGTWEVLADAVYLGGSKAIKKPGGPLPGQIKHEWADRIGPYLDPDRNESPSFCKLRDGLRRLAAKQS